MKANIFAVFAILVSLPEAHACLGAMTEKAQEYDASVLFVGEPTSYELSSLSPVPGVTTGRVAKVGFRVEKTLNGENKKNWEALIRGDRIPATLQEFEEKFGRRIKVGLRDFGNRIDHEKLPEGFRRLHFVVDAACSMNGEDWLLWKPD